MSIRALVIDDERLARNRLRRLLLQLEVEVIAEGENGEQAIAMVKEHRVDIVFLDINMPVLDGLSAAQQISELENPEPPSIVFCTAYDEFALEAFNANASAYLVKPVNADELSRILVQASKLNRLQSAQVRTASGQANAAGLSVATAGNIENVPLVEIAYFRSQDKHVFAYILERGEVLVDFTLKELQALFTDRVVRTHRSTLVNVACVQKLARNESGSAMLYLQNVQEALPVSRRHLAAVKQCF